MYCAEEAESDEFGGAAFVVDSEEDLILASKTLPGATEPYDMKSAPGGGRAVTFYDPCEGFPFHLVYGQTPAEDETLFPELDYNFVGRHSILGQAMALIPPARIKTSSKWKDAKIQERYPYLLFLTNEVLTLV